ncbi:helix-turn-helix domain-containing protein [Streptomyces sp. CA-132043]|uniref:helix-turn-helix domain-containing protein n=1 Tax=Streptomyces sp. CA-132043 TaxID=3240048 RepID=UPI003D89CDEA
MSGGTRTPTADAASGHHAAPAPDAERIRLLADAVTPRVATLAGALFDPGTCTGTPLEEQVTRCLLIGLSSCVEARPLTTDERRRLQEVGRRLARKQARPPTLLSLHGVVLLGHSEALLVCQDPSLAPALADVTDFTDLTDLTRRLQDGAPLLLRLSEQMTRCIDDGYAEEQIASSLAADEERPLDALCSLITEATTSWQRPYLAKIVQASRLADLFPATVIITQGHLVEHRHPTTTRLGDCANTVLAPLDTPYPHTLILCSADATDPLLSWLRNNTTAPAIHTRAVALHEAPARYAATRDILHSSDLTAADRLTDARTLLWRRVLANQRMEYVGDYVEEVIGPILRLPETQRDPLLETLESLDGYDGSVRDAAADLNVHEKTIRYRVSRIETLTGLNALARNHWPQLHQAVQLCTLFPLLLQ